MNRRGEAFVLEPMKNLYIAIVTPNMLFRLEGTKSEGMLLHESYKTKHSSWSY